MILQIQPEDVLKLFLALALGGMIGFEREVRDKAAGFRTLMFICVGSTLFTIFSIRLVQLFGQPGDPARIAAQIVTGVGFLGAGVIMRENGEVRGLTTAATIWLVSAIGVGVGAGLYLFTSLATAVILLILFIFPTLENMMGTLTQTRNYHVVMSVSHEKHAQLRERFRYHRLAIISDRRTRKGSEMHCIWLVSGRPKAHESMVDELLNDAEIFEFGD